MRPASALLLLLLFSLSSCHYFGMKRIRGNGVTASENRMVDNFTGVKIRGGMDVTLTQGPEHSIRIEGDENLLKYIDVVRNGNMVEVSTKEGVNLNPRAGLRIYATAPVFEQLQISGSGDMKSQNTLTSNGTIEAGINGSGDMDLKVDAPTVITHISGNGDIVMNGTTRNFKTSISGSGDVKCFGLLSETVDVDIAGSGDVQVSASKQLNVDIKGSGDVRYKGSPAISQSIKGSGSIRRTEP